MLHANFTALRFTEPELPPIEVLLHVIGQILADDRGYLSLTHLFRVNP